MSSLATTPSGTTLAQNFPLHSRIIFGLTLLAALAIWLTGTNQALFMAINQQHGLLPDMLWAGLNLLCYSRFFILPILLLIIGYMARPQKILNLIVLIIAYYIVFAALKHVVGEARPYVVLSPGSFFWLNYFEEAVKSAHLSFPSGHTGNMAVFAFSMNALFFANKKGLQFLMLLLVILAGLARICTGWHWPLDVITSGLVGYLLVKLAFAIDIRNLFAKKS